MERAWYNTCIYFFIVGTLSVCLVTQRMKILLYSKHYVRAWRNIKGVVLGGRMDSRHLPSKFNNMFLYSLVCFIMWQVYVGHLYIFC